MQNWSFQLCGNLDNIKWTKGPITSLQLQADPLGKKVLIKFQLYVYSFSQAYFQKDVLVIINVIY